MPLAIKKPSSVKRVLKSSFPLEFFLSSSFKPSTIISTVITPIGVEPDIIGKEYVVFIIPSVSTYGTEIVTFFSFIGFVYHSSVTSPFSVMLIFPSIFSTRLLNLPFSASLPSNLLGSKYIPIASAKPSFSNKAFAFSSTKSLFLFGSGILFIVFCMLAIIA